MNFNNFINFGEDDRETGWILINWHTRLSWLRLYRPVLEEPEDSGNGSHDRVQIAQTSRGANLSLPDNNWKTLRWSSDQRSYGIMKGVSFHSVWACQSSLWHRQKM